MIGGHKTAKKTPRRSKQLRGERLIRAVKMELGRRVNLSPKTDPINISSVASSLQVTRQSLYNNGLDEVIQEYAALQRRNFTESVEVAAKRRPLEERIKALEQDNAELKKKLDGWIERWAAVEYNARMLGIDADRIFGPMPAPERRGSSAARKRKFNEGS